VVCVNHDLMAGADTIWRGLQGFPIMFGRLLPCLPVYHEVRTTRQDGKMEPPLHMLPLCCRSLGSGLFDI
jgi:hypothetical protein